MLQLSLKEDSKLVITGGSSWKEFVFISCIALVAIYPLFFMESSGSVETSLKILFCIVYIWIAIINISDQETMVFDRNKNKISINRKSLVNFKSYIKQLDSLLDVRVDDENTPNKFKIMLKFADKIEMQMTNSLYKDKKMLQTIVDSIKEWANDIITKNQPKDTQLKGNRNPNNENKQLTD